ncbi:MAG: ABC transporter permease [Bacillota bacterium]|nr:ABC transporter permease [Bacillota bacterium]
MRAYWQLTLAQLRIFGRNRQVLFWTLFFPIVLMLALGSFLGKGNNLSMSMAVVDEDGTGASSQFIQSFKHVGDIKTTVFKTKELAINSVKKGDNPIAIEIPKGFAAQMALKSAASNALDVPVFYNEKNMAASQLGITVVTQLIDAASKKAVEYKPILNVASKGIQAVNLRYIDFLVPGIVAMMIMSNNMNGVAGQIAAWRERGILRRMQGTRLKASTFIAAQITARLVLNGSQALLVLLIANLVFNLSVRGSWFVLVGLVILGTLAFMAIGFIIAGIAKTPESAGPIAAFLSFPMLFLGGVFFPIKNMPSFLQPFVKVLPISHLSNALRETMNLGTPITGILPDIFMLLGCLVVAFVIASFTFKWE